MFSNSLPAVEWEERKIFKGALAKHTLRVISSTDISVFTPIIEQFLVQNPSVSIEYLVAGSTDIDDVFRQSPDQFDVVISSAMDLQLKLVNDGYAQQIDDLPYPSWAQWRQSLFGFTLEPAAIVVNKEAFRSLPVPSSRQALIEIMREHAATFNGKIGTYDVRQSGLGYLFATQDARRSETYWRLMEIMGSLDTRLYCCSGAMLEDVSNGTIAIAYNVLGSYAMDRKDIADKIEIILPSEFPTTMMRTAFVSRRAPELKRASAFVQYLASFKWNATAGVEVSLPTIQSAPPGLQSSVIALEPGLMTFLDRMKRRLFIKEWESAIIQ